VAQKGISCERENRMNVKKRYLTILIVLILALFFSCGKDPTGENDDQVVYVYQIPALVGDGWETASLQDVGLNPGPITSLMEELLNRDDHLYHSLLITFLNLWESTNSNGFAAKLLLMSPLRREGCISGPAIWQS